MSDDSYCTYCGQRHCEPWCQKETAAKQAKSELSRQLNLGKAEGARAELAQPATADAPAASDLSTECIQISDASGEPSMISRCQLRYYDIIQCRLSDGHLGNCESTGRAWTREQGARWARFLSQEDARCEPEVPMSNPAAPVRPRWTASDVRELIEKMEQDALSVADELSMLRVLRAYADLLAAQEVIDATRKAGGQ